jgi:hypothetical protein
MSSLGGSYGGAVDDEYVVERSLLQQAPLPTCWNFPPSPRSSGVADESLGMYALRSQQVMPQGLRPNRLRKCSGHFLFKHLIRVAALLLATTKPASLAAAQVSPHSCTIDESPQLPVVLNLYMTGFNHGRGGGVVQQAGVDELADYIVNDSGGAKTIVVLSASTRASCDAGATEYNGQCLATALYNRLHVPFSYHGGPRPEWGMEAGSGVIAGPEITVIGARIDGAGNTQAFLVELQQGAGRLNFLVFHSSGEDQAAEAINWGKNRTIDLQRTHDYLPIMLGDFNFSASSPTSEVVTGYVRQEFKWIDDRLVCAGHPERPFDLQNNLMHIFAVNDAHKSDYPCYSGELVPVRLSFTNDADGSANVTSGIQLPDVVHNVVGVGFAVQKRGLPDACTCSADPCAANACSPTSDPKSCIVCEPGKKWCEDCGACISKTRLCRCSSKARRATSRGHLPELDALRP